jgi:Flp pilus assembly protein TadG
MNSKWPRALTDALHFCVREFPGETRASVTTVFALAIVPMIGFVGASVDYSRANSVKAGMQAAADSTALMLSKIAATTSSTDLTTKGNAYFKALFNRPDATGLTLNINYTTASGSTVKVAATADVKTDFMKIMGFSSLKVGVDSTAKWGNTKMRVALALDTTGSMKDDGKMAALKTATKSLLTQLKNGATTNGDVYVSIIPFSKGVNVSGIGNKNSAWIKWSGSSDTWNENNGKCTSYDGWSEPKTKSNCLSKDGTWTVSNKDNWNGCVMDRDQDYDIKNTAPTSSATRFPAENSDGCPEKLMGLTYDWNALNAKVDSLYPDGMTNQVIGLAWGFQSLTAAPFTIPAKDSNFQYSEVLILVTDGENTQTRFSSNKSTIDSRVLAACANAKAAGIIVYTMQINTGGDSTQTFLKTCASAPDKFIEVKSANQVVSAFNSIGTALSNLRIAQ